LVFLLVCSVDVTLTDVLDTEDVEEVAADATPVEEITADGAASNMEDVD
jgi:hypothetical protein